MTAVLRLALLLAAALWSAPAWADPAEQAANEIVKQWGAPGAIIVVLGIVIGGLAYKLGKTQDARLDDQRAFRTEILAANKDSAEGLAKAAAATADLSRSVETANRDGAERGRAFADGLAPLLDIQTGLAANGSALGRIEADVRSLVRDGGRG